MKIYEMWCGWAGGIIVVAKDRESALVEMRKRPNYELRCEAHVFEHEIVDGLVIDIDCS